MERRVVHTDKVPPARVPLSQAIKAGGWVFASGQLVYMGTEPGFRTMINRARKPGSVPALWRCGTPRV